MTDTRQPITGHAAGVPFVAVPPAGEPRPDAPTVVAWHLMDAPRTEAAFAAAVPLRGLDAWRIYFGLPMSGSRPPAGGPDEVMRLAYEDVVLSLYEPQVYGAAAEFGPAFAELRERLGLGAGPLGALGASIGAAVAQLVMAEGDYTFAAAVLVSPVIRMRRTVEAGERRFGTSYGWTAESEAVADRLDFVARAGELAAPAVLVIVGEADDPGFREPAAELAAALAPRAELVTIPGMGHALADEPGIEPAPQTPHATAVDRHAVAWLQRHL
jgi:pimeloyl-ACP methyl ester carboxylesterase